MALLSSVDRGRETGGDDLFKIEMGGQIRRTFAVDTTSNTDTWLKGYILRETTTGYAELDDAAGTSLLRGLALERRSPLSGNYDEDEVQASGKVSMLLSEAIIKTAHLVSGLAYTPGDKMYPDGSTGKFTNVDAGSQPVMGKALTGTTGAADGTSTQIYIFYQNNSVSS